MIYCPLCRSELEPDERPYQNLLECRCGTLDVTDGKLRFGDRSDSLSATLMDGWTFHHTRSFSKRVRRPEEVNAVVTSITERVLVKAVLES
jgi:hypothetical protein